MHVLTFLLVFCVLHDSLSSSNSSSSEPFKTLQNFDFDFKKRERKEREREFLKVFVLIFRRDNMDIVRVERETKP